MIEIVKTVVYLKLEFIIIITSILLILIKKSKKINSKY